MMCAQSLLYKILRLPFLQGRQHVLQRPPTPRPSADGLHNAGSDSTHGKIKQFRVISTMETSNSVAFFEFFCFTLGNSLEKHSLFFKNKV